MRVARSLADSLNQLFGPESVMSFEILLGILTVLMILAGIGVIVGGAVMTTRRVEAGRIIVVVSVAMGVLGLVICLFQAAVTGELALDWGLQLVQSLGWLGAIFALIARIIAEQMPLTAQ